MRMRTKKWARPELSVCSYYIKDPHIFKGKWQAAFKKEQPIWLELGCGKGLFISQVSVANQDKNFIGVDLSSDMLGLSKRNIESAYAKHNLSVDNVIITWQDIARIDLMMAPTDIVDRIFINFCNPWFKPSQYKKRLTHTRQLLSYKKFLKTDGEIWFKTDDDELFAHSLRYFEESGYEVIYKTYSLHESGFEPNYKTEHEIMYSEQGIKIKFLIARVNSKASTQ